MWLVYKGIASFLKFSNFQLTFNSQFWDYVMDIEVISFIYVLTLIHQKTRHVLLPRNFKSLVTFFIQVSIIFCCVYFLPILLKNQMKNPNPLTISLSFNSEIMKQPFQIHRLVLLGFSPLENVKGFGMKLMEVGQKALPFLCSLYHGMKSAHKVLRFLFSN